MSEVENEPNLSEVVTAVSGEDEERSSPSLLDTLAAQRQTTSQNREVYIPIPGYEGTGLTLLARYTILDPNDIARIGKNVMREFSKRQNYERNLYGTIDSMAAACTGIFVENDQGQRQPLEYPPGEPIEGYNDELAAALKIEVSPSHPVRSIILGVFCNNVLGIQTHSMKLSRWWSDTSVDVNDEFLDPAGNL